MAGAGRRFVFEAIFLACLAVAVGLADLSTGQIIGVMAIGWFVTVLIELVSWRLAVRHPAAAAAAPAAEPVPAVVDVAPAQDPEAAGRVANEAVEPVMADEPEPAAEPEPPAAEPEPAAGSPISPPAVAEEPPRRRRRGLFRRFAHEPEIPVVEDTVPEPPRHVRLIEHHADEEPDPGRDEADDVAEPPAKRVEGA